MSPPAAAYYAIAAIPARWALERGAWAEAARLEVRASGFPFADALTEFARALGAARMGDVANARTAIARLEALMLSIDTLPNLGEALDQCRPRMEERRTA